MKSYRLFLWVTLLLSVVCSGTGSAANQLHRGTQRHSIKHLSKGFHFKRKSLAKTNPTSVPANAVIYKPLDLAIPFKTIQESEARSRVVNGIQENSDTSLFGNEKKQAALQVKGQFVMSQEPEADKRKSADGAGIVINLRR